MSYYFELPQTPRAKGSTQQEASPSSSSGNSVAVETDDAWEEATSLRMKDGILHPGSLAPSSLYPRSGVVKGKHAASSSPFLNLFDPRSANPLVYPLPDQAYLSTASSSHGYNTLIMKNKLYNRMHHFWVSNRSYLLVIISTFFGALMTFLTALLENDGHGMHAFQILFLRMVASWVVCVAVLYYTKRSEFPFGPKDMRWVLLMRGAFGFVGIGGLWTALAYLNLSDATVITFLTPSMIAGYSAIFLGESFPKKEMAASFTAMLGVVFIARPVAIFGAAPKAGVPPVAPDFGDGLPVPLPSTVEDDAGAAAERLLGIMLCLLSAVGSTGALLSIKRIGTRASALTTTSYFALISTLVTTTILILAPLLNIDQPQLQFALPDGLTQWFYIIVNTLCGLATQTLMTIGVGGEGRSNKAPAMIYTGMLWTAGFDRWAFGKEMPWTSVIGIFLIVGGALFIALQPKTQATPAPVVGDEEDGSRVLELEPLARNTDNADC